jgi:hypothetical protein
MSDRVTVGVRLWGDRYTHHIPAWYAAVKAAGIVNIAAAVDRPKPFPDDVVQFVVDVSDYRHPQAGYWQRLDERITTEWVWHMDIDDWIKPDALAQVDLNADVGIWQTPIQMKIGGEVVHPIHCTAAEYLERGANCWHAGALIRRNLRQWIVQPDVAWDDWGLWRALCRENPAIGYAENATYVYDERPVGLLNEIGKNHLHVAAVLEV